MIGVTRGISTLVGAVVAGFLLWLATQTGAETSGEYWATYGVIAGAGLTMALSQILGGWTKWGWPRFSTGVFTLAFLPVLVAAGWILLARQPADWMNTSNWSRDLGIFGVVADLGNVLPAIAFGVGLVFGLSFDTAGRRREIVEQVRQDVPHDETVHGVSMSTDADNGTVRGVGDRRLATREGSAARPESVAPEPNEQEDRARSDEREDERRRTRDVQREHPDPEQ